MTMNSNGLTSQQQKAIEHGNGPLLVVAGAGTGKTLVITHRIAHLVNNKMANPDQILALTFTEKAAAEMAERVDVLLPYGFSNVPISTFHAFGDQIIRHYGLELGLNPDFQVLSQPEQMIFFREHLFDFPLKHYRPLSDPARFIQAMLTVISRAKDEDVTVDDYRVYAEALRLDLPNHIEDTAYLDHLEKQEEISGTYTAYQQLLAGEGKADFGDQVSLVLKLFRERPTILQTVRNKYKYVLVDEFQDTNYAQFQLIQLLGGDQANITVVGDDDQSIYKFRGAAISNILSFMEIYPKAKQVVLTENFRSTQIILDTAYRLISHNNPDRLEVKSRINKRLKANREGQHIVEHLHCDTLTTESDRVAQIICDLIQNKEYQYNEIAILVRANRDADPFIRALNMKQIPWRFSGNRGLYNRPEVKILISFLKLIADPHDTISLYHLASSEIYELSVMEDLQRCVNMAHSHHQSLYAIFKKLDEIEDLADISSEAKITFQKIVSDIHKYLDLSRNHITGNVLYQFITESNYLKRLAQQESLENHMRIQNIANFFNVIWAFAQVAKDDRVLHFVQYLDLLIEAGDNPGTAEADPAEDAVHILTVHKAKGLEWPVVFMVSLLHNKFPHTRRKEPIELPEKLVKDLLPEGDFHLQEERRLFYVGMTRAKERLYFTSAQDYGGVRKRKISQFILEALDRPNIEEINIKSSAIEQIQRFAPTQIRSDVEMNPIPADVILNLSHYQVDDYQTCPLKYKYVHILRLPFFHHTIVYGKAVHSAVELYFRHKINGLQVQLEDLYNAYETSWRNIGFLSREHEERRFEAGKLSIKKFYDREEASGIVPMLIEEKFSFLQDKNRVAGRWDRIDERDGKIVIVDFKTSEVYDQESADKKTQNSLQLAIYGLAYLNTCRKLPDFVELHFLESGLVGRTELKEKQLDKAKKMIVESADGIRKRDYSARPGYKSCRICAYTTICPSAVKVS